MRRVPSRNSSAEMRVRRLLTRMGLRYRLHRKDLPGQPDIVFIGRRLVIFVHGCFWHGHDCARGARAPKANAEYWQAKIQRNRDRDARVQADLVTRQWRVEVVWECELKDEDALRRKLASSLDLVAP